MAPSLAKIDRDSEWYSCHLSWRSSLMNIGGGWQEMKKYPIWQKASANDRRSIWNEVSTDGNKIN